MIRKYPQKNANGINYWLLMNRPMIILGLDQVRSSIGKLLRRKYIMSEKWEQVNRRVYSIHPRLGKSITKIINGDVHG